MVCFEIKNISGQEGGGDKGSCSSILFALICLSRGNVEFFTTLFSLAA